MNIKTLFAYICVILTSCSVVAQKGSAISTDELRSLIGCWQGTLHYSGTLVRKPYTTTAQLVVTQIGKSKKFQFLHIYTPGSEGNVADTIEISADARKLNGKQIKSKRRTTEGNLEIITEAVGFDEDSNKEAVIREIYTTAKQHYTYKKQLQLTGQNEWLERQEFKYIREICK